MNLGLQGRTALITGASKGIGYACARSLAREGVHVHLAARTAADLDLAAQRIGQEFPVTVTTHPVNLSGHDACATLAAACADVDIVVNNAGAIPAGTIDMIDDAAWRAAWDLKVFGYISLCRDFLGRMAARFASDGRRGVIVNIIGAAGEKPMTSYPAGTAGNAALMGLTRALGARSSKDGVRVVGINPGMIETDRMVTLARQRAAIRFGDSGRWRDTLDADFPPGQPAHIADMVAFLASDHSANTTGTIITIDGGASNR